jgi:hypothetical protein
VLGSKSLLDCACQSNFYGKAFQGDGCLSCKSDALGISCPFNSSLPLVSFGYYRVSLSDPNNVIQCIPSEACAYTDEGGTVCFAGYEGYLCGVCGDNYFRNDNFCRECPSKTIQVLTYLAFIFAFLFLCWRLTSSIERVPSDLRIMIHGIQLIALYPSVSTKWPGELLELMRFLSFTVSKSVPSSN